MWASVSIWIGLLLSFPAWAMAQPENPNVRNHRPTNLVAVSPNNNSDWRYLATRAKHYWDLKGKYSFQQAINSISLISIPPIVASDLSDHGPMCGDSVSDEMFQFGARLSMSQKARLKIRLMLKDLKIHIIEKLMELLRQNPPTKLGSTVKQLNIDEKLWLEASNQLADTYIRAVDLFLETHPGAMPRLGKRGLVFDLLGIQNAKNTPWCADWASFILEYLDDNISVDSVVNKIFRIAGGQQDYPERTDAWRQHNFVVVYPSGRSISIPLTDENQVIALDPWRTILPKAHFLNFDDPETGYYTLTNFGFIK